MDLIDKIEYYEKLSETIWRSRPWLPQLLFEYSFVIQGVSIVPGRWKVEWKPIPSLLSWSTDGLSMDLGFRRMLKSLLPEAKAQSPKKEVGVDSWSIWLESPGNWKGREGSTRQN